MSVPFTIASGFSSHFINSSSFHVIPDARRESEYRKPLTVPALRPTTPRNGGPSLLGAAAWQPRPRASNPSFPAPTSGPAPLLVGLRAASIPIERTPAVKEYRALSFIHYESVRNR